MAHDRLTRHTLVLMLAASAAALGGWLQAENDEAAARSSDIDPEAGRVTVTEYFDVEPIEEHGLALGGTIIRTTRLDDGERTWTIRLAAGDGEPAMAAPARRVVSPRILTLDVDGLRGLSSALAYIRSHRAGIIDRAIVPTELLYRIRNRRGPRQNIGLEFDGRQVTEVMPLSPRDEDDKPLTLAHLERVVNKALARVDELD